MPGGISSGRDASRGHLPARYRSLIPVCRASSLPSQNCPGRQRVRSLETNKQNHSLANELKLCEKYIELEAWRLGPKLSITWNNDIQDSSFWQIPKLLFQPLIENSVVHGKLDDGSVNIIIDLKESKKYLSIKITNDIGNSEQSGNGIAVENIRERLFTLYDDQYKFKVNQSSAKYSVIMQIPKITLIADKVIS